MWRKNYSYIGDKLETLKVFKSGPTLVTDEGTDCFNLDERRKIVQAQDGKLTNV